MFSKLPWTAKRLPVRREDDQAVHSLQHEVNRLFEEFLRAPWESTGAPLTIGDEVFGAVVTRVDMSESEKELVVKAELPGLTDKEIEVSVHKEMLTIRGEKKQEKEENEKGWYRMECQYGAFSRTIPLPYEIDIDKIEAYFKNGVLTVKMPKLPVSQKTGKTVSVKNV